MTAVFALVAGLCAGFIAGIWCSFAWLEHLGCRLAMSPHRGCALEPKQTKP